MTTPSRSTLSGTLVGLAILTAALPARAEGSRQRATQLGMPTASAASLGFSQAGLDQLSAEMHALVDQNKLAGVTTLIARHGKVVHFDNIQGYIVEKLSGQSLDVYFDENIFKPLGMVDTGFWVPESEAGRVVAVHRYDAAGKVTASTETRVTTGKPSFLSGSGGLLSTAKDYWRFAQAIGNGGVLDGKRILKARTVQLMRTNVLSPDAAVDLYGPGEKGVGFGMDFAIIMDPKAANTPQGVSSFYWGGAFGTWFWIDPTNDLVFVGMIQNQNGSRPDSGTPRVRPLSIAATYKALVDPRK